MKRKHFLWLTALVLFFVLPLSVQAAGTYYIEELDCSITLPDDWVGDTRESMVQWGTGDIAWMEDADLYFFGDYAEFDYSLALLVVEEDSMDLALRDEEGKNEWNERTEAYFERTSCTVLEYTWIENAQALFLKSKIYDEETDRMELDYTTVHDGQQWVMTFRSGAEEYSPEQEAIADEIIQGILFSSGGFSTQSDYYDDDYGYYDSDGDYYSYDYDYGYEEESGAMDVVVQLLSRGAGIVAILMVVFLASRVRGGIREMVSSRDVTNLLEKLGTMKDEGKKTQTKSASSETRPTANSGLNGLVDASKYDYAQRLEDYGLESPALPVCRKCKKKAQKPSRYCAFCDEELPKT